MGRRKRGHMDPTDDWEQLELLCAWEEQREYERIRPLVLFGGPVPERATETGSSERTLYRRIALAVLVVAATSLTACGREPGTGGSPAARSGAHHPITTPTTDPTTRGSTAASSLGPRATTLRKDGVLFIRQEKNAGWYGAMTALAVGDLVVDEKGCMRLGAGGDLLVWPPGFRLSTLGDDIRVIDGKDEVAARVGDRVEVSGGQSAVSENKSRAASDGMRRGLDIPEQCSGSLFIVGAGVRSVGRGRRRRPPSTGGTACGR